MKSVRVSVKTWRNRKLHKAAHTKPAEIPEGTAFVSDSLSDKKYRKNISQGLEDLRVRKFLAFWKTREKIFGSYPAYFEPEQFSGFCSFSQRNFYRAIFVKIIKEM